METVKAKEHKVFSSRTRGPAVAAPEEVAENSGWLESLEDVVSHVLEREGSERANVFLGDLIKRLRSAGVRTPSPVSTPYLNTIPVEKQPEYPGDRDLERRIKSIMRWNAMAMVVNSNRNETGVGGAHFDLCFPGESLRGGFQPFLSGRGC